MLRNYLHDFFSNSVPDLLNKKAKEHLVSVLEEVKTLNLPAAPAGRQNQALLGLQLKSINEKEGIHVQMNTFIEDPSHPTLFPQTGSFATGPALINALPKSDYDIAIDLDEGMINRILQISYERGFFKNLPIGSTATSMKTVSAPLQLTADEKNHLSQTKIQLTRGNAQLQRRGSPNNSKNSTQNQVISLTQPPLLKSVDSSLVPKANIGETYVRAHVNIQVPTGTVSGFKSWMLDDAFLMSCDLILNIKKSTDGKSLQVFLYDVVADSIKIDPSYFTWLTDGLWLENFVTKLARNHFKEMVALWRKNNVQLPGSIPVPELLGISFSIHHLDMEPTGRLAMYLNYSKDLNSKSNGVNGGTSNFPKILVSGLSEQKGQYLTAIYSVALASELAISADNLQLKKVYSEIANVPITGDSVELPAQSINWTGWARPNVVLFVIHSEPNFSWINPDPQSPPIQYQYPLQPSANNSYSSVSVLSTRSLRQNTDSAGIYNYIFDSQRPLAYPHTNLER